MIAAALLTLLIVSTGCQREKLDQKLFGKWQNLFDRPTIIEFHADGTVSGTQGQSGTYEIQGHMIVRKNPAGEKIGVYPYRLKADTLFLEIEGTVTPHLRLP